MSRQRSGLIIHLPMLMMEQSTACGMPQTRSTKSPGSGDGAALSVPEKSMRNWRGGCSNIVSWLIRNALPFTRVDRTAQDDGNGGWHGYPIGWKEVPSSLRTRWQKREKRVSKREIDRYWEG